MENGESGIRGSSSPGSTGSPSRIVGKPWRLRNNGDAIEPQVPILHSRFRLRVDLVQHPRECDAFADVLGARDPRDRALDAQAEARVRYAAVLAQVEVPLEGLARQLVLRDALLEQRIVVDALRPADQLE